MNTQFCLKNLREGWYCKQVHSEFHSPFRLLCCLLYTIRFIPRYPCAPILNTHLCFNRYGLSILLSKLNFRKSHGLLCGSGMLLFVRGYLMLVRSSIMHVLFCSYRFLPCHDQSSFASPRRDCII
jgi:hypothetical protein